MRKFIGFLAIAASVLFSFAVSAAEDNFEDGAYTKVKGTYTPNTLVEYFSFFCGHCVRFQPTMRDLERDFPEVKFSRVHVAFLGGDVAGVFVVGVLGNDHHAALQLLGDGSYHCRFAGS